MSQIKPDQINLIKHMLKELESPSEDLTEWETNFVESVTDQFNRKGSLSERQVEILEKIYTEKTA